MKTIVESLIGCTFESVESNGGEIVFRASDGTTFSMHHQQSCCEHVFLEDVCGDLDDLVGTPIVSAFKGTGPSKDGMYTFYHVRTHQGTVTFRWNGSSDNYSVDVDIFRYDPIVNEDYDEEYDD